MLARINPGNDLEKLIREERVGRVCTGGGVAKLQTLAEELLADEPLVREARDRASRLWERRFSSPAAVRQVARALQAAQHNVSLAS